MSAVVFYPTLTGAAFPYAGVHELHTPALVERSLRERRPVLCLLDHNWNQLIASTVDNTLRLSPERDGVRCEIGIPATPLGRRVAAAFAAKSVTGCSIGFTTRRARWHLGGSQLIRELVDIDLDEVSLLVERQAANPRTWARVLGPKLQARYAVHRASAGAYRPPDVPPADVTLRLAPLRLTRGHLAIARERREVEAAALAHPGARVIDVIYARRVADLAKAAARHAAHEFHVPGNPQVRAGRPAEKARGHPGRRHLGRRSSGRGHRLPLSQKGATDARRLSPAAPASRAQHPSRVSWPARL